MTLSVCRIPTGFTQSISPLFVVGLLQELSLVIVILNNCTGFASLVSGFGHHHFGTNASHKRTRSLHRKRKHTDISLNSEPVGVKRTLIPSQSGITANSKIATLCGRVTLQIL